MLGERRRCKGARETHFGSSEFIVQSIFEICLSAIHNTRVAVVQLGSNQSKGTFVPVLKYSRKL